MKGGYTMEKFNSDLTQLGGMIENFYTQQGGKRRKHKRKRNNRNRVANNVRNVVRNVERNVERSVRKLEKNVKNLNKKSNKKVNKKGPAKRNFKILTLNGKPYPYPSPYKGAEPKDAAKKAFHFACKKLKMNKNCKLTFTLKETTRGSDKRTYGPYTGYYKKRSKPKTIKFPGMTKPHVITHDRVVKLHKNAK